MEFRVKGMHCPACPALIDELIAEDPVVTQVSTVRKTQRVQVNVSTDESAEVLLERWNPRLSPHGYQLLPVHQNAASGPTRETWWGIAGGAAFLGLFLVLQWSGWLTLFAPETLEAPGAFLLGVLASLSSCFALVGGLLMTFTASVGQSHPQRLPAALTAFHGARLATFVVLGGVLGQLGQALSLDQSVFNVLFLIAAVTMLGLGLNLLGVIRLPGGSRDRTRELQKRLASAGTTGAGFLLGVGTFFLPCGFTQTVQFQALAAGSFGAGALLMGAFALGTLPVLLLVSFALKAGLSGPARRMLLAGSGVVVLGLGLVQLQSALVLMRVMKPLLVF